MRGKKERLFRAGIITLIILVGLAVLCGILYGILYVGYCKGVWGEYGGLLHYLFQCSCSQSMENIQVQKMYSEYAEIMFPACGPEIGPIPSPSGQKVAVINFDEPDESYVWFLQTDERMPFSWPDRGDLDWLTDNLLIVHTWYAMNVVDLNAVLEYSLPERAGIRLGREQITPSVLSALQKARYVILGKGVVAVISPHTLTSPEHSFVIRYNIGEKPIIKQILREQDIDYLDYTVRRGIDVLYNQYVSTDLISPDGRFLYKSDGIYLVETGEQIVDWDHKWGSVDWVYDGVIINLDGTSLIDTWLMEMHIGLLGISEPWIKLRVPAEYNVSTASPNRN